MRFKSDNKVDSNWKQRYLDVDQINDNVVNKLVAKDFLLDSNDLKYVNYLMYYILSNIFNIYFSQSLDKEKI